MTPATAERERCARLIELIAADWREAGAMQKVWAAEYLAREIRDLADEQSTRPDLAEGWDRDEYDRVNGQSGEKCEHGNPKGACTVCFMWEQVAVDGQSAK